MGEGMVTRCPSTIGRGWREAPVRVARLFPLRLYPHIMRENSGLTRWRGIMKRVIVSFSVALLICVLGCPSIWAQATAQISGTVRDQSGAVLPGVEVTATQTDTGISRSAVSNET